jgi:hypothetical protein
MATKYTMAFIAYASQDRSEVPVAVDVLDSKERSHRLDLS